MTDQPQLELPFDSPFGINDNPALWTPRDIWVRLSQRVMGHLGEDRRIEYKRASRVDFEDLATYFSMFSNTPDGGVIVFGADSKGQATGCAQLAQSSLNRIQDFHLTMCPQARPEVKRIPVVIDGQTDFCEALYIPYVGKLVETNKSEAWIRYGDSRHKMSEEEKRDFRSTRQELSFELEAAPYKYPDDFDMQVVQDFCDSFRQRENRSTWSNEEILIDRFLGQRSDGQFVPHNALVLMAAKNPRRSIPGCRVRIQRFGTEEEGSGENYRPLREKWAEGNIVQIIREASTFIEETIFDVTWLNPDGKFVTTPEYPRWAWFESLVNACVHRSYSFSGSEITVKVFPDRLEVESPGGFVPPVNENTIYVTRATRNYHLMDALRYLGYVQMAREGTKRIRDSMKEWSLPAPLFKQEALHGVVVRVTLKNDDNRKRATDRDVAQFFGVDTWKALQDHEIKIVGYAFRNKMVNVSEASRITGRTWQTTKKDLDRLARRGLLIFIAGEYQRDPKAHYILKATNETTNRAD